MSRLSRRSRRLLLGTAAVGTAAAVAAVTLPPSGDGRAAATTAPTATAPVSRTDLVETTTVDGTLGYADRRTIAARTAGTITALPRVGSTVRPGQALYRLDGRPVTLLSGRVPAYRTLQTGTEGEDVRQLEAGLRALGHRGFTVDDEYTRSTAAAVRRWQKSLGVERTGRVELGSVVFGSAPVRIGSHAADVGDAVTPGSEVLTTTSRRRIVTIDLEVDKQRLVRPGGRVGVELPDGTRTPGTVEQIATVAEQDDDDSGAGSDGAGSGGSDEATVEVVVRLSGGRTGGYDSAPVDVELESARRNGVLTVPVVALLALQEGGYGVRVVEGGATRVVRVTPGLFARGRVEVTGDGLREGLSVEVPA